ncbi:MAG: hypothetical protein MI974_32035 [Chitinophagales bacterium]|nr:hypothetical protein [Chitinophagales bacterium]
MPTRTGAQVRPKKKAKQPGNTKLAVIFTNNTEEIKYMRSTPRQDRTNAFIPRMKKYFATEGKWNGRVKWAAFYENGIQTQTYEPGTGWAKATE